MTKRLMLGTGNKQGYPVLSWSSQCVLLTLHPTIDTSHWRIMILLAGFRMRLVSSYSNRVSVSAKAYYLTLKSKNLGSLMIQSCSVITQPTEDPQVV